MILNLNLPRAINEDFVPLNVKIRIKKLPQYRQEVSERQNKLYKQINKFKQVLQGVLSIEDGYLWKVEAVGASPTTLNSVR